MNTLTSVVPLGKTFLALLVFKDLRGLENKESVRRDGWTETTTSLARYATLATVQVINTRPSDIKQSTYQLLQQLRPKPWWQCTCAIEKRGVKSIELYHHVDDSGVTAKRKCRGKNRQ